MNSATHALAMLTAPPPAPLPQNRAQRRAASQNLARAERAQRRSRARVQRALAEYSKEIA